MRDPVATFEAVRDFYITYLETAFRIGEPGIPSKGREHCLNAPGNSALNSSSSRCRAMQTWGCLSRIWQAPGTVQSGCPASVTWSGEPSSILALGGLLPRSPQDPSKGATSFFSHQLEMAQAGCGRRGARCGPLRGLDRGKPKPSCCQSLHRSRRRPCTGRLAPR